jgi:P27 family predicted phage terminase small subunit
MRSQIDGLRKVSRNSMRGRKPKPTWLKVIAGNPGRRPLNDREHEPEGSLLTPPEWLTRSQFEVWETAIRHAPPGLLRNIDESVLLVWVIAKDMHRIATEQISETGAVTNAPHSNMTVQSPWVSIMNKQALIMLRAAAEMGFSPSSRSRVYIERSGYLPNKFERINKIEWPEDN